MSSASIQKLFCGFYSAFKCSLDEFVGEKVVSPSYSSTIQEEDITIINVYAPNIGALQYVRQMLTSMKGEINNNTIIMGDFNTPLTPMDRSTKQQLIRKHKL